MIKPVSSVKPTCKCHHCVMHTEDSHGIYPIGVYVPPARLSLRGNKITDERVQYSYGNHYRTVGILPNASAVRYIHNF